MGAFKEPHGGLLQDLYLGESAADTERERAKEYSSWDLTQRQLCDVELLLNGAFSPLDGFLTREAYRGVLCDMRLPGGVLWPIPVNLDVTREFADSVAEGEVVALRDPEGVLIATLRVDDIWAPDRSEEAQAVYGTADPDHPGVHHLLHRSNGVYLGGKLTGVEPPVHYDFKLLRDSPSELRGRFRKLGWRRVVAFHTRGLMHREHHELTFRAARIHEANLLVHPVVGLANPGDVDYYGRVRCYEHVLEEYPEQTTSLSLLNLATRLAGPREAVWHAIVRKNFGCTHFIVEPDHAAPGRNASGKTFYGPTEAQELACAHEAELDIAIVPCERMVYVEDRATFLPLSETTPEMTIASLPDAELDRRLRDGLDLPDWFSYPKVVEALRHNHPPRHEQGFTVLFTGLSGSGKSTIAKALMVKLLERGGRRITLLDGDLVRKHLSSELGFSREHRNLNVLRIGYVASEITKNRGIALCAPIAPYAATRREIREMVARHGGFVEVHVSTSLEVCEQRDRKGLYAKARQGLIPEFTGISDPYEVPEIPDLRVDTQGLTPELAAHRVLVKLESLGFIR